MSTKKIYVDDITPVIVYNHNLTEIDNAVVEKVVTDLMVKNTLVLVRQDSRVQSIDIEGLYSESSQDFLSFYWYGIEFYGNIPRLIVEVIVNPKAVCGIFIGCYPSYIHGDFGIKKMSLQDLVVYVLAHEMNHTIVGHGQEEYVDALTIMYLTREWPKHPFAKNKKIVKQAQEIIDEN